MMWAMCVVLISIYMVRDTITLLILKSKSGWKMTQKKRVRRVKWNGKKKKIRLPSKTGIAQNGSGADTPDTV